MTDCRRDEWLEQLSAYVDDELTPTIRDHVRQHLVRCSRCRSTVADLQAMVRAAPQYPGDPSSGGIKWSTLQRALPVSPRGSARLHRPWRRRTRWQYATAASIAAVLLVGGMSWIFGGSEPGTMARAGGRGVDSPLVAIPAVESRVYEAAVSDLEGLLLSQENRLAPETAQLIRYHLQMIDRALADSRKALRADPANQRLAHRVDAQMQQKLNVLRQAFRATRIEL